MVHLYLDTNVLLHFRDFTELDWKAISIDESPIVVLCMPVIHELDEKKSDHKRGHRARRVVRTIKDLIKQARCLRPPASFKIDQRVIPKSSPIPGLDLLRVDHQIIAIVKKAQEEGDAVAVITDDVGMQILCDVHGIRSIELDATLRLSDETDDSNNAGSVTRRKLPEDARKASLRLCGASSGSEVEIASTCAVLATTLLGSSELLSVDEVKAKYPLAIVVTPPPSTEDSDSFARNYAEMKRGAAIKYNSDLAAFFDAYVESLDALDKRAEMHARSVEIDLWVANDGTLPTEDISLCVKITDEFVEQVDELDECEWRKDPEVPSLPKKPAILRDVPKGILGFGLGAISGEMEDCPLFQHRFPDISSVTLAKNVTGVEVQERQKGCFEIAARIKRIRHNDQALIGSFSLLFVGVPRPVRLEYKIIDSENAKPTIGTLVVMASGPAASDS